MRLEVAVEGRDGAGQVVAHQEGDDADHREASVLELRLPLLGLLLLREATHEAQRIPELDLGRPDALPNEGEGA